MKKITNCYYFHKSNLYEIKKIISYEVYNFMLQAGMALLDSGKDFEVIKYNKRTGDFTFVNTMAWNELYEPWLKTAYFFKKDGTPYKPDKITDFKGKLVYHQKHLFVVSGYQGFDLEESRKRTKLLESIPEVKDNKSRIGSKKYWVEILKKYDLPLFMELKE